MRPTDTTIYGFCERFFREQGVKSPEDFYQSDRISLALPEFCLELWETFFHKDDEDDED